MLIIPIDSFHKEFETKKMRSIRQNQSTNFMQFGEIVREKMRPKANVQRNA